MSKKTPRQYVKYLYVSKYTVHNNDCFQYDVAFITAKNQYVEYELVIRQTLLTYWVLKRLNELFSYYIIDSHTEVGVSNTMDQYDVFVMYLRAFKFIFNSIFGLFHMNRFMTEFAIDIKKFFYHSLESFSRNAK